MDDPGYISDPVKILFGNFVLSIINKLSKEKAEKLSSLDLAAVFKTTPKDWRLIVKEVLDLSDTIEVAILDLWYTNQRLAFQRKIEYHPEQFAIDFVDNYLKEDSKIDVWPENSLALAKERIRLFQSREN